MAQQSIYDIRINDITGQEINLNDFKGKTSDEVLFDIAERKREIMNVMLDLMKNSAIDCSINLYDNIKTTNNIKCQYFSNTDYPYSYTADIHDELDEKIRKTRVQKKKFNFKTITALIKGEKTKLALMDNKIYDYEKVISGRPGKAIGEIKIGNNKKTIKFF